MILGIGTDIVEISRFNHLIPLNSFMEKCFTPQEIKYINNRAQSAAACYAAKEAYSKALGTGIRGFSLKDIEIFHDELGKPYIKAYNQAATKGNIFLSLSHSKDLATAFVIIEK